MLSNRLADSSELFAEIWAKELTQGEPTVNSLNVRCCFVLLLDENKDKLNRKHINVQKRSNLLHLESLFALCMERPPPLDNEIDAVSKNCTNIYQ